MLRTKQLIALCLPLALASAVLITGAGCGSAPTPAETRPVAAAPPPSAADDFPAAITRAEWAKLLAINTDITKNKKLTDSDIDFVAHMLNSPGPPPNNTPKDTITRQRYTIAELTSKSSPKLSPGQAKHLYDVVVPCASSPDSVVRNGALLALQRTDDPRTLPLLEHVAKTSPNKLTRDSAAVAAAQWKTNH